MLLQALEDLGVREVVLAPGSRSAPLAHALADAARPGPGRDPNAPGIDLHVRIDERAAGFLALGLARGALAAGSPRPVAVVTTSGTAVANLHPAALEAHHSGLPLLLLTADRPHELRGTGANQATEQVGLLEPVRMSLDVPAPTGRVGEDRDLRNLLARAVAAALGSRTGDPGPVHLNLAYREPLVPDGEPWPARSRDGLTEIVRRGGVGPATLPGAAYAPLTAQRLAPPDGVRTVVVAGDGAGPDAERIAAANDWPLLAEPTSGARWGPNAIGAYRLLLDEPALGGAVQRVVVLGRPTLSRPVQALLARVDVESLVIAPVGARWPDAARNATQVVAEVPPLLLAGNLGAGSTWLSDWQRAGSAAARAVAAVLAEGGVLADGVGGDVPVAGGSLTGPGVAIHVAAAAGPDDVLVVGSSNPVRDLDLVAAWDRAPTVLANRGLAGIDGTLATAAGVALAMGRPVRAYVGDLTFLHDLGSLLVGPLERPPDLSIVVANDDGGSIFATLEHGDPAYADGFERVFGTPHGADLARLCLGYGVAHTRVVDAAGLRAALAAPIDGIGVIEVCIDRSGRRELSARLSQAARVAAREVLGG